MLLKAPLATPLWLTYVESNLRLLIKHFADENTSFSFCETFTGAPAGTIGWKDGAASYHYVINGRDVDIRQGARQDVSLGVVVDYDGALREATQPYTPEFRRRRAEGLAPSFPITFQGDPHSMPEWLREIHNMNAAVTMEVE